MKILYTYRLAFLLLALMALASLYLPQGALAQSAETEEIDNAERRKPEQIRGEIQARPIALMFAGMDVNRDKRVTREEAATAISADWLSLSPSMTNKIGAFKIQDWALETLGSAEARPSRISFDRNLDNQVSGDEFEHRLLSAFDTMDEDKDGVLTRAELVYLSAARIRREERGQDGGDKDRSGQKGQKGQKQQRR